MSLVHSFGYSMAGDFFSDIRHIPGGFIVKKWMSESILYQPRQLWHGLCISLRECPKTQEKNYEPGTLGS